MMSVALHLDDASGAEVTHVSRCPSCLARLESLRAVLDAAQSAGTGAHLPDPPASLRSRVLRVRSAPRRRNGEAA
jgi:hypothetical protein